MPVLPTDLYLAPKFGLWNNPICCKSPSHKTFNTLSTLTAFFRLHRRPTKLCTTFGRLLRWHTIYTYSGLLSTDGILPGAKFTLHPSLLYWQRYCKALQQRASAKLCGMVQGIELRNFRRGRHLFGWAAITLGIGPHSSLSLLCFRQDRQIELFNCLPVKNFTRGQLTDIFPLRGIHKGLVIARLHPRSFRLTSSYMETAIA